MFKFIVKKNTKHPICILDLKKNESDPGFFLFENEFNNDNVIIKLHEIYTKEQLKASRGLKEAIQYGWLVPIECDNIWENNDQSLLGEIDKIKSTLNSLLDKISNITNSDVLTKKDINKKDDSNDLQMLQIILNDIKEIKKKTIGIEIEGYSELKPEDAAILYRKNKKIKNISSTDNIKIDQKNININIDDKLENLE